MVSKIYTLINSLTDVDVTDTLITVTPTSVDNNYILRRENFNENGTLKFNRCNLQKKP